MRKKLLNLIWITIGLVSFVLGTIGAVLPVLPTVPFYMAAAFCFAKSSEKLHHWLINTKLYHHYLESFVSKKEMTIKNKLTVLGTVTLIMAIGFFSMKNVPIGRICIAIVWIGHIIFFTFRVKTCKPEDCLIEE